MLHVSPWIVGRYSDVECCMVVWEGFSKEAVVRRYELECEPTDAHRMQLRAEKIAAVVVHIQACVEAGGPYATPW